MRRDHKSLTGSPCWSIFYGAHLVPFRISQKLFFFHDFNFPVRLNIPERLKDSGTSLTFRRDFFWLFPPEDSTLDRNVLTVTLFGKNSISSPGLFCQRYGRQIMTSGRIEFSSQKSSLSSPRSFWLFVSGMVAS